MQRQATTFFTLHTVLFTPRTSHFTLALHTPHFISSQTIELFSPHLSSSHLIPSVLTCHKSKFFSTVFISSEHWSTFLISSMFVSTHLSCSARQRSLTVREKSLAQKKRLGAETFAHRRLRHICIYTEKPLTNTLYYKACTKHFPQNTLYYKACTKHFPVLLCTTKLAPSTSQYYFVLQSLHKALPSTTLCYKACTKPFPVLLCTTKLAQSTSQYYFVLRSLHKALSSTTLYCNVQSLHKARSSTTLYYKPCTKYVPVLHCTTKLAQSNSQYYFVLQSLRKLLPELLCTTQLAQSTSQYYFVLLCTTFCYKHCTK